MKAQHALLVGAVLLAGLALAGTATAGTADVQFDGSLNETTNTTDTPDVGVCMIGVDSPCNGEEWDGDDDGGLTPVEDSETRDGEELDPVKNETDSDEGSLGVCMIGVESPCNGEENDGDGETRGEVIEPVENDEDGEVGICLVGVDSPCNGDADPAGSGESSSETSSSLLGGLLGVLGVLF